MYVKLFYLDNKHEISGSNARLSLLRLRSFIDKQRLNHPALDTIDVRTLRRLLVNLSHIQQLAYSTEMSRNTLTILAMHNLTFVFKLDYIKVIKELSTNK